MWSSYLTSCNAAISRRAISIGLSTIGIESKGPLSTIARAMYYHDLIPGCFHNDADDILKSY